MSKRISRERLARITSELTPRDREMVEFLARVKLATGSQLRRAVWTDQSAAGKRSARRALARLVCWRVLARLERRQGGLGKGSDSWTYALDTAGQRLLGEAGARRPHLPRPAMWAHVLLGTEVAVTLAEALRGTDRTVAIWQGEPECWRSYTGSHGQRLTLKPDAFVDVLSPEFHDVSYLEADTGSQSRTVIRAKLAAYQRYAATGLDQRMQDGIFPLTVFVTVTPERQAVLVDLVNGHLEVPAGGQLIVPTRC
ncbi:replication-relaxation family protein [Nakamurella sp. PAMC28650]|uniref:replication-relaxation family protein n=1 Tax=Nakamurella sp. PAMC28650 TaxID=2762325 RepID=UPI00164E0B8B|nr:replication-relaxation family protein [Nakamurella sp. PAMC28650]QNK81096.1 replication-relaxation family protein [Nakamurella sp. PAMC28650]